MSRPNHPITKHLAVGYWKGGDLAVEETLYQPQHIEKIVAWGGLASVKHVTRYIQPGLELIALDPKRSATIIGPEAFDDDDTMREVARRAATDIGVANQEGCANARVIYVLSGTDADGLANANRFGEMIYQELISLPAVVSTPPRYPNRELLDHLEASRMTDDFYRVIGGEQREGAIVVSQFDEPVDYSPMLSGRVANIVPVDSIDQVTAAVNAYTQTIGIYPESLKRQLRDTLPLFGAQRLTSLGYACNVAIADAPGRHRADPADVQVDRRRGMRPRASSSRCGSSRRHDRARAAPWTSSRESTCPARSCVITGASSGLGRESARALAAAGAQVILAARNTDALAEADRLDTGRGARRADFDGAARPHLADQRARGGRR